MPTKFDSRLYKTTNEKAGDVYTGNQVFTSKRLHDTTMLRLALSLSSELPNVDQILSVEGYLLSTRCEHFGEQITIQQMS